MKTYVRHIDTIDDAELRLLFEKEHKSIMASKAVLIQVFSGQERAKFKKLLTFFKNEFPHATLIASSTDGEIYNDKVSTKSSVITLSIFEKTTLRSIHIDKKDSFENGVAIAKALVTPQTKLLISFVDGLLCNGEEFLNGIYSIAPDVKVAGGLSADNAQFENCFVGEGQKLYDKGAVAVALDSQTLKVESLYNFGWEAVGVEHTITHADKNRVYTIDDMHVVDFYTKYLGSEIATALPKTGIEFPLIMLRDGVKVARACLAKHQDGSLSFAGDVHTGSKVFLGIGDIDKIIQNPIAHTLLNVETFFIYSCMARRRFMPDMIEQEIQYFSNLAPTSGFFTYGEFYTAKSPQLLNQTLTAVGLCESDEKNIQTIPKKHSIKKDVNNNTFSALTHLLKVTASDLRQESKKIADMKKLLVAKDTSLNLIQEIANLGSWEFTIATAEIAWSDESFRLYKRDPALGEPSYLEFVNMVVEEDRKKFIKAQNTLINGNTIHSIEIRVKRCDGKIISVIESAKLVIKDNKPYKILGTALDITELKEKDSIITQQSKLAQMGEMINMIAHQWRQPLNAISAAAIKMNMQNDMDMLTDKEIQKTTEFIEEMTQEMSKTINDFMNFTKPTDAKIVVKFSEVIDDIMRLMHAQLANHNIKLLQDIEDNLSTLTYKKDLEHVLINLFSNAKDALDDLEKDDKELHIRIYEKETKCFIEVSDNAGGIDADIITRVFDPYFTTKEQGKGTGLGLYMTKKILKETLDGDIYVENSKNGAKFTVILSMCHDV